MIIDPSAYFSVLFVEQSFLDRDPKKDEYRTLNYTFFGTEQYRVQGVWANANITCGEVYLNDPVSKNSIDTVNLQATIFLAFGTAPVAGISGMLGFGWSHLEEVSLISSLKLQYALPKENFYETFKFNLIDPIASIFNGTLILDTVEPPEI